MCNNTSMDRSELVQFYQRTMSEDKKVEKLRILKEQKKILKQRLKAVENYREIVETQLESILDRIDYLNIYG